MVEIISCYNQDGQIFLQKKFGYYIEYHVLGHLKIFKKQQFRIKAQCPECNAKLYCTLIEKVTKGKDIIFNCAIKNVNFEYIHSKRRQLRGRKRVQVANTIIDNKIDAISYVCKVRRSLNLAMRTHQYFQ